MNIAKVIREKADERARAMSAQPTSHFSSTENGEPVYGGGGGSGDNAKRIVNIPVRIDTTVGKHGQALTYNEVLNCFELVPTGQELVTYTFDGTKKFDGSITFSGYGLEDRT